MNQLPPETAEPRKPRKPNVALWALLAVFVCFAIGIAAAGSALYPMLLRARAIRAGGICIRRLHRSSTAMSMYAADYDGRLPVATAWMDQTVAYVPSDRLFRCPESWREGTDAYGFAMNIALSNEKAAKVADRSKTPMVFDSSILKLNAASGVETLPQRGRHRGGNNVAYVDGHVRRILAGAKP